MGALRRLWSRLRLRRRRGSPEHGELRRTVAETVHGLRELGFGAGWRRADRAPWYVLLGEAQSGKSSALRALGFDPVLSAGAEQPALLAGWCSDAAVCWELSAALLEPAPGQPGVADAASELARGQRGSPLGGALIALPAEHVLSRTEPEREAWARRLRQQLDQLQQRLERELPVYLLLTQVDRLPGFLPFWSRVEPELRQAPWGASWQERSPEGGSFGARIGAEWALLARSLHARVLDVMQRSGAQDPVAVFELTEAFAELGERLLRQVHQLTELHPRRPPLWLRGFYLCAAPPPGPQSQQDGWFFHELFERAILSDRAAVRSPARVLERERGRRRRRNGALLAAAALVCLPAARSRSLNLQLIESSAEVLRLSPPEPLLPEARSEQGSELDALLEQLQRLERASERWSLQHWWGPYAAAELRERVARRYHERLKAVMQGPVRQQLRAELRAVGDVVRFDWHNFRQAADTLKLQLMLAEPARLDREWAGPRLLHSWRRARDRGACGGTGPLEAHVQRWLEALAADSRLAFSGNDALVTRIRARLASLPAPELGLAWLAEAARTVPAVRASQLFDAEAARSWNVPLEALVPGTYTRAGWQRLRRAFSRAVFPAEDAWIFGGALPEAWSSESVQQLHFRRHSEAWRGFLLQLSAAARAPRAHAADPAWGQQESLRRIQVAARPDSPLMRLFQVLAQDVRFPLAEPAAALATGAAALAEGAAALAQPAAGLAQPMAQQALGSLQEKLGGPAAPSPLEQQWAGLLAFAFADGEGEAISPSSALAEYQRELRELAASLQPAGAAEPAARAPDLLPLQRVASTVERLLGTLTRSDRELIEGLLLAPIEEGLMQLRAGEQRRLAELWRAQVAQPLGQLLQRFPFRLGARDEVQLSELQALLEPGSGALWRFIEGELGPRVRDAGGRYELALATSGEAALSPQLPSCLNTARELRELLFGAQGARSLQVRWGSAASGAASLSLTVDGQQLEPGVAEPGSAEQGWVALTWPGKSGPAGASVQLRNGLFTDEIRRMGSFGWLRLLVDGGLRASGARGEGLWEASWALGQGEARVRLELRGRDATTSPGLGPFQSLHCPAQLFR